MSKQLLLLTFLALASISTAQVSRQTFACLFSSKIGNASEAWIPHLNDAMVRFGIDNTHRIRMFMAISGHLTWGYRTFVEYTRQDGANLWCDRYEGGCTFKGRGALFLTHRSLYAEAGHALGEDFVNNPELVAKMPWAFLTAGWFWQSRNLNIYADRFDVEGAVRAIIGDISEARRVLDLYTTSARRCIGPGSYVAPECRVVVRPSDTIEELAARYSTTVASLLIFNPLITRPDVLPVGREIRVC